MDTFAFALAPLVVANVALAWITYVLWQRVREQSSLIGTLRSWCVKAAASIERTSNAKLAAELADVAVAVTTLAEQHRQFAGKVWGRIGQQEKRERPELTPESPEDVKERARAQLRATIPARGQRA